MSIVVGISTPIGSGAISIVRVSGEGALALALRFFTSTKLKGDPSPNYMYLGIFHNGDLKDRCMMVYFRAPRSYTGEDMVEFQLHGGVRLTEEVLRTLVRAGAVMAKEGEFTRRAFLNGKLTLDEAEGVMALIQAESQAEISSAYGMLKGKVSQKIAPAKEALLKVLSYLEASLDFPEEMEEEVEEVPSILEDVKLRLQTLLATAEKGKLVKNGISVVLLGSPNVGKSSLLNAFLNEERAIVTDIPGTTRDTISESVLHKGVRVNLLDTAGVRESADVIEQMGVVRSLDAAARADVAVYLLDASKGECVDPTIVERVRGRLIIVNNKTDVASPQNGYLKVSAKTKEGVDALLDEIVGEVGEIRQVGELLTLDRHVDAVSTALNRVTEALNGLESGAPLDCVAIDVREAYRHIGEIDGSEATDSVIDEIFSRFCVGK